MQIRIPVQAKPNSMTEKNNDNFDSNSDSRILRSLRKALVNFVMFPSTAWLYTRLFIRYPDLLLRLVRLGCKFLLFYWMNIKFWVQYSVMHVKFWVLYSVKRVKFWVPYSLKWVKYWINSKLATKFEQDAIKIKKISSMDEPLPEDIADVLEISAVLEIREYDLFGLAYYWWFGRPSPEKVLESHFARYMFNRIVPLWVRQYSRMVLELQEKGSLDREALGVDRLPDATPESVRAGVRYAVILVTTLCLLVLIAEFAFKYLKLPCFFPPCY